MIPTWDPPKSAGAGYVPTLSPQASDRGTGRGSHLQQRHIFLFCQIIFTQHTSTIMGSVVLPHLESGWHVDQAILSEDERLVVIRFGRDHDEACMRQDEVLYKIAEKVKNFAVIYVCDIDRVPDFNTMYELYDPCTVMFFFVSRPLTYSCPKLEVTDSSVRSA